MESHSVTVRSSDVGSDSYYSSYSSSGGSSAAVHYSEESSYTSSARTMNSSGSSATAHTATVHIKIKIISLHSNEAAGGTMKAGVYIDVTYYGISVMETESSGHESTSLVASDGRNVAESRSDRRLLSSA